MDEIVYEDFDKVKIAVGKIIAVDDFPQARKPAYKLTIDFGEDLEIKKSSAQITENYQRNDLLGKQILGVVNFPPRQIGPFMSEVLTLGVPDENGNVVLVEPGKPVPIGGLLF